MSDQILARYGHLDRDLATVVRTSMNSVLIVVVLRLEEAHRKLVELSRDGVEVELPDNGPSDRLLVLMVELFGVEHTELLDTSLDPIRTRVANLTIDDDPAAKRTVIDLFASVSMFLVAEANMLYQCVDDLPPDQWQDLRQFLGSVAADALARALSLNREVDDTASLHRLLERAAGDPGDETGIGISPGIGIDPFDDVGPLEWQSDSPRPELDNAPLCASADEDAIWEQLQQIYYCGETSCGDPQCPLPPALARPESEAKTARPELSSGESPPSPTIRSAGHPRWRRRLRQASPWISAALTCTLSIGFVASFLARGGSSWTALLWVLPFCCLAFGRLVLELSMVLRPDPVDRLAVLRALSISHRSHRAVAADRRSIH
ncbi:hypothetical protein ACFVAV_33440 [Nocardia sp. NPDC057663]|uniref:hypothetical protein n=1 Tax=Nocardia sp. NPDC057663 TaxID=3346201 RepID=UPI0036706D7E